MTTTTILEIQVKLEIELRNLEVVSDIYLMKIIQRCSTLKEQEHFTELQNLKKTPLKKIFRRGKSLTPTMMHYLIGPTLSMWTMALILGKMLKILTIQATGPVGRKKLKYYSEFYASQMVILI